MSTLQGCPLYRGVHFTGVSTLQGCPLYRGVHLTVALGVLYKVVLTFVTVDKISMCDHSNESFSAVLSGGIVYYAVQSGSNF